MPQTGSLLTRDQLLAFAREHGCEVSVDQLDRWRKRGLIPRPVKRPGRGQGLGREAFYPAGAGPQLVALCELRKRGASLDAARWGLWWRGFEMDERRIRERLEAAVRDRQADRKAVLVFHEDEDEAQADAAWAKLDRKARSKKLPKPAREMRTRAGTKDFSRVLLRFHEMATGLFELWPDADLDSALLAKAMGLTDPPEGGGLAAGAALIQSLGGGLKAFTEMAEPEALADALKKAAWVEIIAARDESRTLLSFAPEVLALVGAHWGSTAQWFLLSLVSDLAADPPAHLLLIWLAMRRRADARLMHAIGLTVLQRVRDGLPPTKLDDAFEEALRDLTRNRSV